MSELNNNSEQTNNENLLFQRLIMFLIVFSIFVLGAVNAQRKILFISILSLGVIMCWVFTFIIIRTAKRIDKKSGGRLLKLLLGFFVPIFCSFLLTVALFAGSVGYADQYLFNIDIKPTKLENKVNEITKEIKNKIAPKPVMKDFKSIDSVINNDSLTRAAKRREQLKSGTTKDESKYFQSIDRVIR